FFSRKSSPRPPSSCNMISGVVPTFPTGEAWKPVGAVRKKNARRFPSRTKQLGTAVKRQHVSRVSSSALKRESLIFDLKYAGSDCVKSLVFKMNRNHSASEQNRRSDANSDNA